MKQLNEMELREVDGGWLFTWWGNLSSFQKGAVIGGGIFGAGVAAGFGYEMAFC
jgi:hypothetical protein